MVSYAVLLCGLIVSSGAHAENIPVSSRTKDEKPYFSVELSLPQKRNAYVVDEVIACTVRCLYDPKSYSVNMIVPPANAEILFLSLSEARTENVAVNGVTCVMHEWHGTLYSKKSGVYECGPFQVRGEQRRQPMHRTIFLG